MKSLTVLSTLAAITLAGAAHADEISLDPWQGGVEPSAVESGLSVPEQRAPEPPGSTDDRGPKTEGVIPHVLIGPRLSLITLPTPSIGLELKAFRYLGASFDYGFIPEVHVSDVRAKFSTWNVGAKLYPFGGVFFVGAALGHYEFTARSTGTDDRTGTAVQTRATVSSTFLAPQLGFRWVGSSGFFTAFDLGWAFPLNYESTLDAPSAADAGTAKDIRENADEYVKKGIPLLGFLGLGWFF